MPDPFPVVWGAGVAFALLAFFWRPWNSEPGSAQRTAFGTTLALCAATLTTYCAAGAAGFISLPSFAAWPPSMPTVAVDWLLASAPLVLLVAGAGALQSRGARVLLRLLSAASAIALVLWFALEPIREYVWKEGAQLWLGSLAAAWVLFWALCACARPTPERNLGVPLVCAISCGGAAAAAGLAGSVGYAFLFAGLGAGLGWLTALAVVRPTWPWARGIADVFGWLYPGTLLLSWKFAEASPQATVLLLLAPLAILLPCSGAGRWKASCSWALVALALCGVAVWLSIPPADMEYSY